MMVLMIVLWMRLVERIGVELIMLCVIFVCFLFNVLVFSLFCGVFVLERNRKLWYVFCWFNFVGIGLINDEFC